MVFTPTNLRRAVRGASIAVIAAVLGALALIAATTAPASAATATTATSRPALTPAQRIMRVAQRWVGTRYVWGGSRPTTGFDCSGYTRWVFSHAHIALLPHQSNRQRFAPRMHLISRRYARPGDLIFYMSGGSAYHVAIYDGHGGQYSAVNPANGVKHQKIYATNIQFRTDWHRNIPRP